MKDSLYTRMTKESWKRDLFSVAGFTAFVTISVAMISLTVMLFVNLTGAIEHLMDVAKTPDFLQMHTGTLQEEEVESFVFERPEVFDYQILSFLNLENSMLTLSEHSLLDNSQDNGLSVQGDGFDYMIDEKNELPDVLPGQVYVPVCYESLYDVKTGDTMEIGGQKLTVAGFIRDSQMNSMMASSKRFLVCEEDYERFKHLGSEEYLIEFLLADGTDVNAFQTAYENAGLPMNGPAITRPLVKMMNTLSDGIMILIILFISVLVLLISLVCIRFMLLTRALSESKEVGIMRAVGISKKEIRKMFLRRYDRLILSGAGLGIILSIVIHYPLSGQMQKLYGVSEESLYKYIYAALSAALIGLGIMFFVLKTLKKLNEMTALKALTGNDEEGRKNHNKLCIVLVTAIAVFLMMIPSNLYSTISSPQFVTYMGIGDGEIRMDMRQGEDSGKDFEKVEAELSKDGQIKEYALYQTSLTPVKLENGTALNMLMEQGDHRKFPVRYSKGSMPARDGEVALSYLLSEDLGLLPGDEIFVQIAGVYQKCRITGIYSDITNGGKTAKLFVEHLDPEERVMWRIAYVTLQEGANRKDFMNRYVNLGAEVVDIGSRVKETYGPTMNQVRQAAVLVKLLSCIIILLVLTMFVRMIIENQRNRISIQKALGIRSKEIKKQFWKSCLPQISLGVILGAIGGCTIGESICGLALKSLGAEGFQFTLDVRMIAINILLGVLAAIAAIYFGSNGINKIKAVECCRGRE